MSEMHSETVESPTGETPKAGELLNQATHRRIFQCVLREGRISRAEISRQTGISPATVSKIVANLGEASLLEAEDNRELPQGLGRPSVIYRPATRRAHIIAVVIDPAECLIAPGGLDCQAHHPPRRLPTPASYEALIDQLSEVVADVVAETEGVVFGVGITATGQVDRYGQRVLSSPNLHILDGQSPSYDLQQRLGLSCHIFHDAEVVLLREWTCSQAVGMNNFVAIVAEEARQGFGLSAVSDGRLVAGHNGMAGELGHMTVERNGRLCGCGNRGCLETRATDTAFLKTLAMYTGRQYTMEALVGRADENWPELHAALDETLDYLAIGVAGAINIYNPQLVLIASGLLDLGSDTFEQLKRRVHRKALSPLDKGCTIARTYTDPIQETLAGGLHHLLAAGSFALSA
jgi:N-acetylglucosamine repressor